MGGSGALKVIRPVTASMLVVLVTASVLAGCGGPTIPATTSYGHGAWEFRVSFLASPTHTGVLRVAGEPGGGRDTYQAPLTNSEGTSTERVMVIELPHHPGGRCPLRVVLHGLGPCPGGPGDTLLRSVSPCTIGCHEYAGSLIILRGKMVFDLEIVGVSKATTAAILDSFSPQ